MPSGFSPLRQIDRSTVPGLKLKWAWSVKPGRNENRSDRPRRGHVSQQRRRTSRLWTRRAARLLWRYRREIAPQYRGPLNMVQRSLAIFGRNLYIATAGPSRGRARRRQRQGRMGPRGGCAVRIRGSGSLGRSTRGRRRAGARCESRPVLSRWLLCRGHRCLYRQKAVAPSTRSRRAQGPGGPTVGTERRRQPAPAPPSGRPRVTIMNSAPSMSERAIPMTSACFFRAKSRGDGANRRRSVHQLDRPGARCEERQAIVGITSTSREKSGTWMKPSSGL